jgi:hypothetical protein
MRCSGQQSQQQQQQQHAQAGVGLAAYEDHQHLLMAWLPLQLPAQLLLLLLLLLELHHLVGLCWARSSSSSSAVCSRHNQGCGHQLLLLMLDLPLLVLWSSGNPGRPFALVLLDVCSASACMCSNTR